MFGKNKEPQIFEGNIKKIRRYISVLKVGDGVNYGLEPRETLMSSIEMDNGDMYNTKSNLLDYKEGDSVLFYFSGDKKIEKNIVVLNKNDLDNFEKGVKQEKYVLRWLRIFGILCTSIILYTPFKQALDSGFQSALNDNNYVIIMTFLFINLKIRFFFLPKMKMLKYRNIIQDFVKKEEDKKIKYRDVETVKDSICQKVN